MEPSKQARTPYTDTTKPGLEASLKEPNELGFTKKGTEQETLHKKVPKISKTP